MGWAGVKHNEMDETVHFGGEKNIYRNLERSCLNRGCKVGDAIRVLHGG